MYRSNFLYYEAAHIIVKYPLPSKTELDGKVIKRGAIHISQPSEPRNNFYSISLRKDTHKTGYGFYLPPNAQLATKPVFLWFWRVIKSLKVHHPEARL